jgi:DNA-directed RNA polymerase subunit RPC12/RpoP
MTNKLPSQQNSIERARTFEGLQCPTCGNRELFVEIMAYETHMVDGQLNYLHLLAAETDCYECHECGELIEFELNPDCE